MHRRSLTAITLAHVSVDMQTGSLLVLLPFLFSSLHLSYAQTASIITANQIVIAITQPLFGMLSDKKSYKWMVWFGALLTGLAMVLVLWMPGYWLVIAAVIVSGLGAAMFHPEALLRIRAVSKNKPASGTSFFFSGGNIGFALGPIVATVLVERLGKPGVLLMLIPTAIGLSLLWSQWKALQHDAPNEPVQTRGSTGLILAGLVALLIVLISLRSTVIGGLQAFIPLYFNDLGKSKEAAAFLITLLAFCGAAGTLSGGLLADRFGRRVTMMITALLALGLLYVFLHSTGVVQMVAIGAAGASMSAAWPIIVVMIQEAMPGRVGLASGLSLGTAYGATGLGVATLGRIADAYGLANTLQLITLLPVAIFVMTFFVPEKAAGPVAIIPKSDLNS